MTNDLSQVSDWMLDAFIEDEIAELNRSHQAQARLLKQRIAELEGPVLIPKGPWGPIAGTQPIPLAQMLAFRAALCAELKIPYPKEWTAEEKRWLASLSKQAQDALTLRKELREALDEHHYFR